MDLDELKTKWTEYDRKLDASLELNRQLLGEARLNRAKTALQRLTLGLGLEAVLTFVAIAALGDFLYTNRSLPRFAFPAAALDLCAIVIFIALIRQITLAMQIDYGKPIAVIQKQIVELQRLRIRSLQGIFLGATLAWIPLLIVAFKGLFGLDTYRLFGAAWLSANVLLGLAIIPLAIWMSKRFGDRLGRFPLMQRLRNDLMGPNLNAAVGFLAILSEFEDVN